jgi:hypothetical protein
MMDSTTPPFLYQPAHHGGFFFAENPNSRAVLRKPCVLLERWAVHFSLSISGFSHAFWIRCECAVVVPAL